MKLWRGVARNAPELQAAPRAVWTFSCAYPNRPKGEQRLAHAFRPGKTYGNKIALKAPPARLALFCIGISKGLPHEGGRLWGVIPKK
jgi:hypothetical protein